MTGRPVPSSSVPSSSVPSSSVPSSSPRILVVAKAPEAGLAKTRLIPAFGAEGAADLAAAALLDTLAAARTAAARLAPDGRPVVALTGDVAAAARGTEVRAALAGCDVVRQRGEGFDERLVAAHHDAAAAGGGSARAVVQIGMDTPQVTVAELLRAAAALTWHETALGLAEDGGWWVLAVREPRFAEALRGVPMSTPSTGTATRTALRAAGHPPGRLPQLRDVDTVADARAVAARAPHTRFAAALHGLRHDAVPA